MAERLKGLLDRANSVLGGLLGDFPQGFNAGAVAGVAGYPGDIAYMLDTAGRALTGQHTQPSAQDFPGTTEYLAAKAGYPVPQSFSGQLGAAVGGILTPGPGDLAKFAPVLSAIPFWHGSPHKYDAVDLSKIGTGEGAQAYGWGYYGADSVDTATAYRDTLTNRTPFHIEMSLKDKGISPELANTYAQFAAQTGGAKASADDFIELMSRDAPSGPIRDFRERLKPEFPSLRSAVKEINGNLYRGEYRWPDPAKEAATPLTGEDLLDWDKPLSEQSPNIQKAIKEYSPIKFSSDTKGADIYDALVKKFGEGKRETLDLRGQNAASNYLRDSLGIPGIRYLDQMSRNAGEGTRNYVFFDQEGIKLLERNGEPLKAAEDFASRRAGKAKPYKEALAMDEASRMQRAREMGFDVDNPVYHGTRTKGEAIDAFDLEKAGSKTDAGYMGKGVYFGNDKTANVYAGHYEFDPGHFPEGGAVYPSYLALKSPLRLEDKIENGRSVDLELLARDALGLPRDATAEQVTQEALRQGYDGAIYSRGAGKYQEYVVFQPEKIRSKFAAFDPAKKNSANLLASLAALGIGIGAVKSQQEKEYQ